MVVFVLCGGGFSVDSGGFSVGDGGGGFFVGGGGFSDLKFVWKLRKWLRNVKIL